MKSRFTLSVLSIGIIAFGLASVSTYAQQTQPVPAQDLGEDVMKPMGKLFKAIGMGISDGTKNTATLQALSDLQNKIDIAIVTVPPTDAYKAEVALVGADAAMAKYQGLLRVLRVNTQELSARVTASGANVCGEPCTSIIGEMKSLKEIAHSTFQDPN